MRPLARRLALPAVLAFAAPGLVACGSGSGTTTVTTTRTVAAGPAAGASSDGAAAKAYTKALSAAERAKTKNLNEAPVAAHLFKSPIRRYRRYALADAAKLTTDVKDLRSALASGDRAAAQAAWRTAFDRYLRLGAVYGEFGNLDGAIDGLPGGLAEGVHDKDFTGLHRIEYGLWGANADPRTLVPAADTLAKDVAKLRGVIPTVDLPVLDFTLRVHEILEDAQRDFLSDVDVPWSHEGVLATASGVAATDELIDDLSAIIPGDTLVDIQTRDTALHAVLAQLRTAGGGTYPTDDQLTMRQRERLDGVLGALLETLQEIPGDLETAPPPPIPQLKSR